MENITLRLPLTRVKKISKTVPAVNSISTEAARLLALTTEKYIELLSKASWNWALANSRKTIHITDIEHCIRKDWMFAILEDALRDWPTDELATTIEEEAEEGGEHRKDVDIIEEGDDDQIEEVEELHESSERNDDYIANKSIINDDDDDDISERQIEFGEGGGGENLLDTKLMAVTIASEDIEDMM